MPTNDKKPNTRRQAVIRRTSESLVVLDNPDDGELFDTGDASDHAGEDVDKSNRRRTNPSPKRRS